MDLDSVGEGERHQQGSSRIQSQTPWAPPEELTTFNLANEKAHKLYATARNGIQKNWKCSLVEAVPAELRDLTSFSLAMALRLLVLSSRTKDNLIMAHSLMIQSRQSRQQKEATPADDVFSTNPRTISQQPYSRHVEIEVSENWQGLTLADLGFAYRMTIDSNHRKNQRRNKERKAEAGVRERGKKPGADSKRNGESTRLPDPHSEDTPAGQPERTEADALALVKALGQPGDQEPIPYRTRYQKRMADDMENLMSRFSLDQQPQPPEPESRRERKVRFRRGLPRKALPSEDIKFGVSGSKDLTDVTEKLRKTKVK